MCIRDRWCPLRFPKFKNPRRQAAAFFKNRKIVISPQLLYRFSWNMARWCMCDLCNSLAVKINGIYKSMTAASHHLEKSWHLCNHLTNFTEIWHVNASKRFTPCQLLKFLEFKKSKTAYSGHLDNCYISCMKSWQYFRMTIYCWNWCSLAFWRYSQVWSRWYGLREICKNLTVSPHWCRNSNIRKQQP